MPSNRDWQRAFNLAWGHTNNVAELVCLLRSSAEVTRKHQGWFAWLLRESSFKDYKKREIERGHFQVPFNIVAEIAADDRRFLADFLAKGRIGRKCRGNKRKPPWQLENALED